MEENEKNYAKRVEALKNNLTKAQLQKENKHEELKKLRTQMENLKKKCEEQFQCKPSELKSKIEELKVSLIEKIKLAEDKLEKINQNN